MVKAGLSFWPLILLYMRVLDRTFNFNGFSKALCFFLTAALLTGCGAVPLTGRKQLLLVSDQEIYQAGLTQYNEFIMGATISSNVSSAALVRSVGRKLATATERYLVANGLSSELSNFQWEFALVDDSQVNAFCLPGGKIVVYEGLLNVATTEAELAAVIGHEIAHAVAKHSNERVSQQIVTQYGMKVLTSALSNKSVAVQNVAASVFGLGAQVGLMLPYSRKHEYEADYMGVVFMEIAGYDSNEAVNFWKKMSYLNSPESGSEGARADLSDFLSTHPSDEKRVANLLENLAEAKSVAASVR